MTQGTVAAVAAIAWALAVAPYARSAAAPPAVETNGLVVSLNTVPDAPARQEATAFEIAIRDAVGHPVAAASVSLDLSMSGMAMAETRPRVLERGSGRYVAGATFSMGGEWRAAVEIVLADGRRARAEFLLRVR